ncbi:S24 family peptidase [Flavobacterium sp. UMI-01]|uniref:S24 family peptidase n=1 Tax=Flavobacterium sp. UMI-01 TaxID=1441053 RepID=UPI001C7D8397|nr:S24 family peptidase [Flavobacterium sp. UMI-01]GIZ08325.1 hypothetical protein FUMI01_10520 [Flavobacterium sp. UMI-01]
MELDDIIREIKNRGLTGYKISEDTGLTQVGIDKILNGTTKKPTKNTLKILNNYLNKSYTTNNELAEPTELYAKGVPYYDVDFTAGFLAVENSDIATPDSYISHPFFKGCDYVVRASGQSMAKVICHGDAIGLRKVNNWQEFFPFGEIYAIVTQDGFRMIKIITKGDTDDYYTLISKPTDSKKDEFPPQQIKKSSILSIFKVQASSHLF